MNEDQLIGFFTGLCGETGLCMLEGSVKRDPFYSLKRDNFLIHDFCEKG